MAAIIRSEQVLPALKRGCEENTMRRDGGYLIAIASLLTLGILVPATTAGAQATGPITVGVLAPLTGPFAPFARDIVDRAQLDHAEVVGQMREADWHEPENWHQPPSGPDPTPRERIDLIGALWYCRHLVGNAIQAYWIVEKNRQACERAKAAVSPRAASAQQGAAQECWPSLEVAFQEVETAKQVFEQAKKTVAPARRSSCTRAIGTWL